MEYHKVQFQDLYSLQICMHDLLKLNVDETFLSFADDIIKSNTWHEKQERLQKRPLNNID